MSLWEEFYILTEDLNLSDTIEAFFGFVIDNGGSEQIFEDGLGFLANEGEFVMVALISIEVMLMRIELSIDAITAFIELGDLIENIDDDKYKMEVRRHMEYLAGTYSESLSMGFELCVGCA